MKSIEEQLCEGGRILFEKRLTDMAGGNISARVGELVYMSPRYAGSQYHWDLRPEDLVVGRWADDAITSQPGFSREGWAHLHVYRAFPDVQGIVHAHPQHVMPFAALCLPMEPVLEATQKFGVIQVAQAAPAHSLALAENVVAVLRGQEERIRKQAAVVLMAYHGVLSAGKAFFHALDAVERVDTNAYCLLARKALAGM